MTKFTKTITKSATVGKDRTMTPNWWGKDSMDLSSLDVEDIISNRSTKDAKFKKLSGAMILFRAPIFFKVVGGTTINGVDDNGKVCIRMDEEEFVFMEKIEEMMIKKLIEPRVMQMGEDPDVMRSAVMSEGSGLPYLKAKIQTLGYSRTTGIDQKGKDHMDVSSILQTPGSVGDFLMRIEGVYITPKNCGILAKVDMFRLTSVPSALDIEEDKKRREEESKEKRDKRLAAFIAGGDVKRVKK